MRMYDTLSSYFSPSEVTQLKLEELLSVSFIVIDDLYSEVVPQEVANRPGPSRQFADSEVLAISWVGQLFGVDSENAWVEFVRKEFSYLFPHLPERSRFNRRRRNLFAISSLLRKRLLEELPKSETLIVDSLPMPICDFKRAHFSNSELKTADAGGLIASYGHCETKGLGTFLGFRVHLLISDSGIPLRFAIANADIDERLVLNEFDDFCSANLVIGDKGYVSEPLRLELLRDHGVALLAQKRDNQKKQYPLQVKRAIHRIRKRVETTINQLEDQFQLSRVRATTHWGVKCRLIDKFAAFTFGIFLNSCLGRPLLALKGLVFA